MPINVNLTHQQGTPILRVSHGGVFPAKIGKKEFSSEIRGTFLKEIRQLYKAMKAVSPILSKHKKLYFGPEEWYVRRDVQPKAGDVSMDDPADRIKFDALEKHIHATHEVALTGQAKNGLFRILYLLSHAESPFCVGGGMQDDIVWPIAEQIRCVPALEEAVGLKSGETVGIAYDVDGPKNGNGDALPETAKEEAKAKV